MLQREHDFHQRFIETRRQGVSDKVRVELHEHLIRYATGETAATDKFDFSKPLMLTGPQGSGTSTVMAGLAEDLQQRMGNDKQEKLLVIPHFAGASPASTELRDLLARVVEMLGDAYNQKYETGVELRELIATFQEALEAVPEDKEMVLIIDAINQFTERNGTHELHWIPHKLPENVKVVLSTIHSGEVTTIPAERAQLLGYNRVEVEPLTLAERKIILREVPAIAAKTLSDRHIDDLLRINASKNPLFLRVALEELRGYGTHDTLEEQIEAYQSSGKSETPLRAIFAQVFKRLEEQFDSEEDSFLTREVLSLLGAARRGLTEDELDDLTTEHSNSGDLLFLLRHLRPYLMRRGPIITFFHDALFDAVHHHYYHSEEQQQKYHQRLADYFGHKDQMDFNHGYESENREPNVRKVDELPYHLLKLRQPHKLAKHLKELSFVEAKAVSGLVIDLAQDYRDALKQLDPKSDDSYLLNVLSRAIDHEIGFLIRHPELIFQVCWNRGWWYDAPEVAKYADISDAAPEGYRPPWKRLRIKASDILNMWEASFMDSRPSKAWGKQMSPSQNIFSIKNYLIGSLEQNYSHLAWSANGEQIAMVHHDGISIWCLDWQKAQIILKGHEKPIWKLAWSPSIDRLATISSYSDGSVYIWDQYGGGEPIVLNGHESWVQHLAWSPSGNRLATASDDGTARIWDPDGQNEPIILNGHEASIKHLAWSPSGDRLATASSDGTARIWNPDGQNEPIILNGHEASIKHLAWSPSGDRLATASSDGTARIWHEDGQAEPMILKGHEDRVELVAWTPSGDRLATASDDGTARIWDPDGKAKPIILKGHEGKVNHLVWSPSGDRLATASNDGTGRIWKPTEKTDPLIFKIRDSFVTDLAWSPGGEQIATVSRVGRACIWEPDRQGEPMILKGHGGWVEYLEWSPSGNRLATASDDGTARIWDPDGKAKPIILKGHKHVVTQLAWSPSGDRLATASWDGTARIWNPDGQAKSIILKGHEDQVNNLAWSPSGNRLATASWDGTARIWNPDGQAKPIILKGHEDQVNNLAWSPSGNRLATASWDGTARIWNPDGQVEPIVLKGHEGMINHLAWSPSGDCLATASKDCTARIWNPDRQAEPMILKGHGDRVTHLAWSLSGDRLATASDDGTARIWDLSKPEIPHTIYEDLYRGQLRELLENDSNLNDIHFIGYQNGSDVIFKKGEQVCFYEKSNIEMLKQSSVKNLWAGYSGSSVVILKIENVEE
jgi:WD40 repeat protein